MNKANGKNGAMQETQQEVTLRDVLSPLFRHQRVVMITFCTALVATILVAWLWASQYYVATMQVVVEQDRSDSPITAAQGGVIQAKNITLDQVSSEVALLQGEDMMRTIAATCGLDKSWSPSQIFLPSDPAKRQAAKIEMAARKLSKKIDVEAQKTSDVIDVKYGRAGEPETPACVLQTLAKLYMEKHLQLQRPQGTSDFFASEADRYRKALDESEQKLTDFSRTANIAAPDLVRTDMATQLAMSEAALYAAQQAISADTKRMENISEQLKSTPSRSSTAESSVAANLLLENLNATLLAAQNKRSELLMKYDPSYPLVKETDEEIAHTKAAIADAESAKYVNATTDRDPTYELLREDLAKTQADLATQRANAAAISGTIKGMRSQMVSLDADAVKQAALLRDAKASENSYMLYLAKRDQERTSDALDKKSIANVAIAVPPVVPVLPAHSPWLVMLIGLIGSTLLALAAGFIAEQLDPSFRTPDEVMQTLSIPVLASVPKKAA
jgi:polysaccharide biosynthesis transport protein